MNFTWFASAYDTDDVQYRLLTFVQIAGVLIVAAGVPRAFEDLDFTIMVIGYVIMRIALVAQWLRAAREDPEHRAVALRFAWASRCSRSAGCSAWPSAGRRSATSRSSSSGCSSWRSRTGPSARAPMTPWHPGHIVERYGLFTIIVLGECILATMTATQVAFDAGGRLGPLLAVAAGGLILVFALWWSYFKHEPDVSRRRSLGAMIAWGYGHYFVFAAVAALGAGLQVAADTTHDATDVTPAVAAMTVAVPVVVYLVALAFLHAQRTVADPDPGRDHRVPGHRGGAGSDVDRRPGGRRRDGDPGERAAGGQHRDDRPAARLTAQLVADRLPEQDQLDERGRVDRRSCRRW